MVRIEDEYVSFETARMLKKAGFDVPTRGTWRKNYTGDAAFVEHFYGQTTDDISRHSADGFQHEYLAPTQALAARCVETDRKLKCLNYGKWYLQKGNKAQVVGLSHWEFIPAYTLQNVLDALPASIKHKDFRYYLVYNKSEGFIGYYGVDFDGNHRYARYEELYNGIDELSVIDSAYEILVWCIENKFVETNKNE